MLYYGKQCLKTKGKKMDRKNGEQTKMHSTTKMFLFKYSFELYTEANRLKHKERKRQTSKPST